MTTTRAKELHNFPTTPVLRSISVTVSTSSVAVDFLQRNCPFSLNPTTCGSSMETGWPSMAASASMPPTPQPSTPRPLIIVVCESVPTSVSGYANGYTIALFRENDARQIFQIHLVDDSHVRRHNFEVPESRLSPAQKRIALFVALKFQLRIYGESAVVANSSTCTDDQSQVPPAEAD